jgi:ATP-dependent Clp protease protease subunit
MKSTLEEILSNHSGKTVKEVTKACERDNFMSPKDAKDFGLIDEIVTRPGETK